MMGMKERNFSPLSPDASLEELVSKGHFYRVVGERFDLSFVRELAELYAERLRARGLRASAEPEENGGSQGRKRGGDGPGGLS